MVQTFLPYPSFALSAAALDPARLGKQRIEVLQLANSLTVEGHGFRHHPASKMWAGRIPALVAYGLAVTDAWTALGRADSVRGKLLAFAPDVDGMAQDTLDMPRWLGDASLHLSHRSNLVRKDPGFYLPQFGPTPDDLPYVWPDP